MADQRSITSADKKNEYNYGIDALRMLAMFLVVTAHILGPGGILEAAEPMSAQYKAAWFLEITAYCSVNCYALISGYVGIYAKYKYHNLALLWLRVVFYTLGITLLFSVFVPGAVTLKDWLRAFLPVTAGYYWYLSAYFALFFFIPLLNTGMDKLTRRQLGAVVIGLILVFSFLQTLSGQEVFGTSSNAWWLMILYIIGGYLKKYGLFQSRRSGELLLGFLGGIALTWFFKMFVKAEILPFTEWVSENYLFSHSSPTIVAAGIFLLLLFERIHPPVFVKRFIRTFAPAAFSVYIIHAHPLVWDRLLTGTFAPYARYSTLPEIIMTLLTALIIYVACSLMDLIREGIFKMLKLKELLARVEKRFLGHLWNQPVAERDLT